MKKADKGTSFSEMSAQRLGKHLMEVQKPYLQKALETILRSCAGNIIQSGNCDENCADLAIEVEKLGKLVEAHFLQEEEVLYPKLQPHALIKTNGDLKKLEQSLDNMRKDHQEVIRTFGRIRELSNNYQPKPGAPANRKLCYAHLFNFEQDMLKHIFLEEDLLFPKLLNKPVILKHPGIR